MSFSFSNVKHTTLGSIVTINEMGGDACEIGLNTVAEFNRSSKLGVGCFECFCCVKMRGLLEK